MRAKMKSAGEWVVNISGESGRSSAAAEWRRSWPIPAISFVALIVAFSHVYTVGIFLQPLQQEFGWSRTSISSSLTIVSVISVVLAPVIGAAIDRFGSRGIAISGLFLYCTSFAALSLITSNLVRWWIVWTALGIGSTFVKPTVWAAAISSRFDRSRGLAMAVALCGSGLGGMFLPIISSKLIEHLGWRSAFAAIGLGEMLLALPLVVLFFRPDDPAARLARTAARHKDPLPGFSVRDVLRSRRFIMLAAATLLITTALLAIVVHLVPILMDGGMQRGNAAAIAGLVGLSTIVGRLSTGALIDRYSGTMIGMIVFAAPIVTCVVLLVDQGSHSGIAAALLLGLSVGAEVDIVMYLASRYFGLRNFGTIYGCLNGLTSLGTGLGPLLAGLMFDHFGSYHQLILILIPVFAASALLVGSLGRYPAEFDRGAAGAGS